MTKKLGPFQLRVEAGSFAQSETIVMLGQNGTGKTTMIKMLAGLMPPDTNADYLPKLNISYKPQTIAPKFDGTVENLFTLKLGATWNQSLFKTEVILPLNVTELLDNMVQNLSGGELQRVALVLCLAKPCDIYLIDEPSAYLDSEQRVIASRVMKRWIMQSKRSAFVVEHDFIMATYMADRVILFDGEPAKDTFCTSPETMVSGMNKFLKLMDITFRRDPTNFRPRINKFNSQKDQLQKKSGNYFQLEESSADKAAGKKKKKGLDEGSDSDVDEIIVRKPKAKQVEKPVEAPKSQPKEETKEEAVAEAAPLSKKEQKQQAKAAAAKKEDEDEWASDDDEE